MSSAAYIATPKVRHIAAWTANDREQGIGQYRTLCAKPRRPLVDYTIWPDLDPNALDEKWRKRFEAAMRRPVCKDCTRVARAAYTLTAGGAL